MRDAELTVKTPCLRSRRRAYGQDAELTVKTPSLELTVKTPSLRSRRRAYGQDMHDGQDMVKRRQMTVNMW